MNRATLETRFLKITKIFAKLGGIWPDQNKIKFILWAMVHITMGSFVVVQVARVVHIGTLEVVIEQSSLIGATILMIIKHGNYILNAEKLKSLLNDMSEDWAIDRLKQEFSIMTTYANRGSILAMFYFVNACICAFLFLQLPWTMRLVHLIKPHNTSPPMLYTVPAYYFVEDDLKYYYYIQIYLGLAIYVVLIVFISCDTCYMVLVQHACGLLTVAGYRFKNAINEFSFNTKISEKKVKETYDRVRFSIQGHQRAIMFLEKIESAHVTYLFMCMGIIVLCVSITMVQIATMEICMDFYKFTSFLIIQFLHLFYLTMQGQFVINSSDEIYDAIYEASWYKMSTKTQALYILALRRSLTPCYLTAGGLIQLNMQSFSEVIKLCVSYYTVLRST
ncbi:odorant receptor 4-like [Bombus affinis]|uniref:odorant receptor 4-like n=1 Tax=Bombus affinis TaxID=309941 RepID=UPI0021423A10|nr:odorant receptor 4-like [Bombus affinis]